MSTHLKDLEKTFNQQNAEYNEAITALDAALELLSQVREGSFIQVEQKESAVALLESKMRNLKHRRVMFAPLIKAFLQVADPTYN